MRSATGIRASAAVEAPPMAAAGRVKLGSSDLEVSGMIAVDSSATYQQSGIRVNLVYVMQNAVWEP